jgi:hypothetical protein
MSAYLGTRKPAKHRVDYAEWPTYCKQAVRKHAWFGEPQLAPGREVLKSRQGAGDPILGPAKSSIPFLKRSRTSSPLPQRGRVLSGSGKSDATR